MSVGKTEVKDGNLTIKNLSPAESGVNECEATNSMGTKKVKMNVAVQKQPLKGVLLTINKTTRFFGVFIFTSLSNVPVVELSHIMVKYLNKQ